MRHRRIGVLLGVALALLVAAPLTSAQPRAAEQIVFSGDATGSLGRVGFWVWCEDTEARNPYAGECNGSMNFFDRRLVGHVDGDVIEVSSGIYRMDVVGRNVNIRCSLSNTTQAHRGPSNTVTIMCQQPSGTAISHTAVVNVTGP